MQKLTVMLGLLALGSANVYADATLAQQTLGWAATRSYEDIINSAFNWHRSQSDVS